MNQVIDTYLDLMTGSKKSFLHLQTLLLEMFAITEAAFNLSLILSSILTLNEL